MSAASLNPATRFVRQSAFIRDVRSIAPVAVTEIDDDRWPAVADALAHLHATGRHSVRIVDADCGSGDLLLHAVRHARALGFTAIEARGIDAVPALVERGRSAASELSDPAIGIIFDSQDLVATLAEEAEFPADIILWCGEAGCRTRVAKAVAAAGFIIITGPPCRRAPVQGVAA